MKKDIKKMIENELIGNNIHVTISSNKNFDKKLLNILIDEISKFPSNINP